MQDKKPDALVSENGNLVTVTTPEYVKDSIKEAIDKHAASRNHPYATHVEPGFVTLSDETDSDSELTAATSKAVKKAYDLANTANQNALNNNSNLYLEKQQNGADIPDKAEFIKNIGAVAANGGVYPGSFQFQQVETTPKESNPVRLVSAPHQESNKLVAYTSYGWYANNIQTGVVRGGGADTLGYAVDINNKRVLVVKEDSVTTGSIHIRSGNYGGVISYRDNGTYWRMEGTPDDESILLNFIDRNPDGSNRHVQSLPKGTGSLMSTSQHYVDASGFVKKISPIIKMFSDGSFETNDESNGATVERLSKGTYLITGVGGFNNDSALDSIEAPLCQNKLPLIWVNHEILPDGSIKLMTYHREHSDVPVFARNIREGHSDGDLIDIPEGRFVSVRVQIPSAKGG
ncbi:phage tail protein [Xenorhabdus szentirmaii]|uniref:phage tail protein n=1 Tax=Xenorhabdus szentirmaii TaxID=290112 RepID=UPI0019971A2F|nr:phage tail protein [Xenorhabdus sp. CUL]MBD2791167.1 tail fiber protein [Xenorhabdus sp. CUL]